MAWLTGLGDSDAWGVADRSAPRANLFLRPDRDTLDATWRQEQDSGTESRDAA
jgi:hypothetical protein